jgi:protease IV
VNRKSWVGGIILGFVVLSLIIGMMGRTAPGSGLGTGASAPKVKIIYVDGVIAGGSSGMSFLGTVTGSDPVIRQLKAAREDPTVQAVVLRINSPGGTSAAAEEIGVEVKKLKAAGKTVVASMGDVAASGGYWVAAYAERIIANAATTTGSIGVISQISNYTGLYDKVGVETITIKSGEFKDMGSDSRDPSQEEIRILQDMVDDIFEQFISVIAEGRDMDPQVVRRLADGRVYTGRQALELGLVDEIGNFYTAIERAAELAGIDGRYSVEEYRTVSWWDLIFSQSGSMTGSQNLNNMLLHRFLLLYNGKIL